MTEAETEVELSRVSRNVYGDSDNKQLQRMVQQEKEEAVYGEKKRFVGWKVFDKKDWKRQSAHFKKRKYRSQKGDEVHIKLDKEKNILGILGQIGSGKTVLLRGFSNRGFEAGVRGIHLADTKGDMHSNNYEGGVQKEIENLRELERPKKVPTVDLMPRFIKEFSDEEVATWNQFFQFSFEDLTAKDFNTMMPSDTDNKEAKVDEMFDLLKEGEIEDFESAADWLDDQNMNYSNKNALKTAVNNIVRRGVLGTDYNLDIPRLLADNESFVAINMSGHDDIPSGFPQMYVGKNVRDIWKAKKYSSGPIPKSEPLEFYLDEAHEFLEDGNVAEKWINKAVKKNRYLLFRFIWATHFLNDFEGYSGSDEPSDLPELVRQTKHFCVAPDYGADACRVLLKHCGIWRSRDYDDWREIFELMKQLRNRGVYVWLYMNTEGDWLVFESASSLANHG